MRIGKVFTGWLAGSYEDVALYEIKEDADIGYCGGDRLYELFDEYDEKKIKITIEIVEE